jgi:hypothetical protein
MATALETPQVALALYAQRILPYQAWARTSKAAEKGPETLARYFLAQLGEICSEVSQLVIPERASDADKVQMLLGYLAKPPGKIDTTPITPTPTEPKEEN